MITLRNKLYESLLDDEDELTNKGDDIVTLNDKNSAFYKHFISLDDWHIDFDEMPVVDKNKIIFKENVVISENHNPLSSYISNIDTIEAQHILLVLKDGEVESNKTLCKNLKANQVNFHAEDTSTVKNININLNKLDTGFRYATSIAIRGKGENGWYHSGSNFSNPPIIFENVNIKTPGKCEIDVNGLYLPKFINTKISCKYLSFSLSDIYMNKYKSVLNDIDKYLDMNYVLKFKDLKSGEDVEKNKMNLKRIGVIAGNFANKLSQPIAKFKQGTKMTDIFPDFYPSTDSIEIFEDNMTIKFHKEVSTIKNRWNVKEFVVPLDDGWVMEVWRNRLTNAKYQNRKNWDD